MGQWDYQKVEEEKEAYLLENKRRNFFKMFPEDFDACLQLGPGPTVVYQTLLMRAFGYKNSCFPGLAWIAAFTRLSRTSVIHHLKTLEENGMITIIKRKSQSGYLRNTYIIHHQDRHKDPMFYLNTETSNTQDYGEAEDEVVGINDNHHFFDDTSRDSGVG